MTSFVVKAADSKYSEHLEIKNVKLTSKEKKFQGEVSWRTNGNSDPRTIGEFSVTLNDPLVIETEWQPVVLLSYDKTSEFSAVVMTGNLTLPGVDFCDKEALLRILPEWIFELSNNFKSICHKIGKTKGASLIQYRKFAFELESK